MRSLNKLVLLGSAFVLVTGATNAGAMTCDSALSSYNYHIEYGEPDLAAEIVAEYPECFGGSSTTSQTQINSTSVQQAAAISAALASRTLATSTMGPEAAGLETKSMAAGGKGASFNTWASGTINSTDQDYILVDNVTTHKNETTIRTGVLGGDYALSPTMAVGLSVALDEGSGFGINTGAAQNSFTSKGYLVAPYFGLQINKELALDISAGLGKGELDTSGGAYTESDRYFAASNLSYSKWMGNAQLTGKLGYIHAEEKYDNVNINGVDQSGTDAKNKLDQMRAGVQAGYWMNGVMPYLGLAYTDDMHRSSTMAAATDPIGKDALIWTAGVNFFALDNAFLAGLSFSKEEGRSNQENDVIMANINYRF